MGDPILDEIAKALKMVGDLCNRRREWVMSIPANEDRDPDLIIAAGLRAGREEVIRLREEFDRLRAEVARLDEQLASAQGDAAIVDFLDRAWVKVEAFPRFQWMSDKTGAHPDYYRNQMSSISLREAVRREIAARAAEEAKSDG